MSLNEYHITYPNYFNENHIHEKYMYGSINNWMIVYKKAIFTKTNENRNDIYDNNYATYMANKLRVVLIIDKFVCSIKTNFLEYQHFDELLILKINNVIKSKTLIRFYKSCEVAHYQNIPIPKRNILYTGHHKSWYDNGRLSSEGDFQNGEKEGTWIYYYNFKDISRENKISDKINYSKGQIVK